MKEDMSNGAPVEQTVCVINCNKKNHYHRKWIEMEKLIKQQAKKSDLVLFADATKPL